MEKHSKKTLLFVLLIPKSDKTFIQSSFFSENQEYKFEQYQSPSFMNEKEQIITFHSTFLIQQQYMILNLLIDNQHFQTRLIKMTQSQYQFIYNIYFHIPFNFHPKNSKTIIDSMNECILNNYSEELEIANHSLNIDYSAYLSIKKKHEYIQQLANECLNNSEKFIDNLSEFVFEEFQSIEQFSKIENYKQLISQLISIISNTDSYIDSNIQLNSIYLLLLLYFKYEEGSEELIAQLNCIQCNEYEKTINDNFIVISTFNVDAIDETIKILKDINTTNRFLSSILSGKKLIEIIIKLYSEMKAIYQTNQIKINHFVQCPLNEIYFFVDLLWMINEYFVFYRGLGYQYQLISFPFSTFNQYIQQGEIINKQKIIIIILEMVLYKFQAIDYPYAQIMKKQFDDMLIMYQDKNNGRSTIHNGTIIITPCNELDKNEFGLYSHFILTEEIKQIKAVLNFFTFNKEQLIQEENLILQNVSVLNLDKIMCVQELINQLLLINFKDVFKSNFSNFILIISSLIKELSSFPLLLELASLTNNQELIPILCDQFFIIIRQEEIINQELLNSCITELIMAIKDQQKIKSFLKETESVINKTQIIYLYDELSINISDDDIKQIINTQILLFLESEVNSLSVNNICVLLFQTSLEHSLIIQHMENKVIDIDLFFSIQPENKLILLTELIKSNFFDLNSHFQKSPYYVKTQQILDKIKEDIDNEKLTFEQIREIHNNTELFEERIHIICFNNEAIAKMLLKTLNSKCQEIRKILENIHHILLFYQIYFKNKTDMIEKFNNLKEIIQTSNFHELYQFEKEFKKNELISEKAILFNQLFQINFFASMIYSNTISFSEDYPNNIFKQFTQLKEMLLDNTKFNKILFFRIINLISSKKHFHHAFKKTKEYFKITSDITTTENDFLLMLRKKYLNENIKGIIFYFQKMKKISPSFIEKLNKITNNIDNKRTNEELNHLIKDLAFKNIDYPISKNKAIRFLSLIQRKKKIVDFIISVEPKILKNISEFVDNTGEYLVDINTLKAFISLHTFIYRINEVNNTNELELLKDLGDVCRNIDYYSIYYNFTIIKKEIIPILKEAVIVIGKKSFLKSQISRFISTEYKFKLKLNINDYQIIGNNTDSIFRPMLNLYYNSFLLPKRSILEFSSDSFSEIIDQYMKTMVLINEYIRIATELKTKGYLFQIKKFIHFNSSNIFISFNDESNNASLLIDEVKFIKQLNTQINEEIILGYKQYSLLRFFYGNQLRQIYKFLLKSEEQSIKNHFQRYLMKQFVVSVPQIEIEQKNMPFETSLEMINTFLNLTLLQFHLNEQNIYQENIIKDKENNIKGIYCKYSLIKDSYTEVLLLYQYLTNNFPIPQTILLCNQGTGEEEITAFIYRCILCIYHVVFVIVNLDCLRYDLQLKIIKLISAINNNSMNSVLFLVYSEINNEIIHDLLSKKIGNKWTIILQNVLFEKIANVDIFYSDESGMGKTRQIQEQIFQEKGTLVYLSLENNFSSKMFISKLLSISFTASTMIHLDIFNTPQNMNDLLFQILILKYYYTNKYVIYFGSNLKIFVEFSCEGNIFSTLFFPQFFTVHKINKQPYPILLINNQLTSNFQIALHYLQLHFDDKSDMNNLPFPDSRKDNDLAKNLLDFFFAYKTQNYYQTISEINILAKQLRIMSNCDKFKTNNLGKYPSLSKCKTILVETLIRTSKYVIRREINKKNDMNLLVFFNSDQENLTVIRYQIKEPDPELDSNLLFLSNINCIIKGEKKLVPLIDYGNLSQEEYEEQLQQILTSNLKSIKQRVLRKDINLFMNLNIFSLIVLIYLRINSNIPVILIGEAGSGKSSIIKKLETSDVQLIMIELHQRITFQNIIDFMLQKVLLPFAQKQVVVYFKNINSCNCLSLLSEIMFKRTICGENIKDNINFIASGLPHRRMQPIEIIMKDKKNVSHQLVYKVNDIPIPFQHFQVNYFKLDYQNNLKFIANNLIESCFTREFDEYFAKTTKQIASFKKELYSKIMNILYYSLDLLHTIDYSFFNIRDVEKFIVLFSWFIKFFQTQKSRKTVSSKISDQSEELMTKASLLAFYICFFLKFHLEEDRLKIEKEVNGKFKKYSFLEIIEKEQLAFANNIDFPKGIAKNRYLIQNLFALFVCINSKIPIFLIGKSGYSKSLSVNLILSVLKNNISLFSKISKIAYIHKYQGSFIAQYDDVNCILTNAQLMANENILSIVYFDNMEDAILSKDFNFNLSFESIPFEKRIVFIGTSRSILDSSQLSQGIVVCSPQFNKQQISNTTKSIVSSYSLELTSTITQIITTLINAYFEFITFQNTIFNYENFHGIRDYYQMLQTLLNSIASKEIVQQISLNKLIKENFDGLCDSIQTFKNKYKTNSKNNVEWDKLIPLIPLNSNHNCLIQNEKRFPLIIAPSSLLFFLVSFLFHKKDPIIMIGSQFINDKNDNHYQTNQLSFFISQMSQPNKTIIIKDCEFIYPALFELFDHNSISINQKNYIRITHGMSSFYYFLNTDFRCIIYFDPTDLSLYNSSIINRCEKQLFSKEMLLSSEEKKEVINYQNAIESLVHFTINKTYQLIINLNVQLINVNCEEFYGIIYQAQSKSIIKINVLETLLNKIIPTLSQDIIAYSQYSDLFYNSQELYQQIIQKYKQVFHHSLHAFLLQTESINNVVYTFSNSLDTIDFQFPINNSLFTLLTKENIYEQNFGYFTSENEVKTFFNNYYTNEKAKLCVIRFIKQDFIHLNHLMNIIEENQKIQCATKAILFIFHIQRQSKTLHQNTNQQFSISFLSNFNQIFIDSLNGKKTIEIDQLFSIVSIINIEKEYYSLFEKATNFILEKINSQETAQTLLTLLSHSIFVQNIKQFLLTFINLKKNKLEDLLFSNILINEEIDCLSKYERQIRDKIVDYLIHLLLLLIKNGVIIDINKLQESIKNKIIDVINIFFKNVIFENFENTIDIFSIEIFKELNIPLFSLIYDSLNKCLLPLVFQYSSIIHKELENYKCETEIIIRKAIVIVKEIILSNNYSEELFLSNDFFQLLIQDYETFFLFKNFRKYSQIMLDLLSYIRKVSFQSHNGLHFSIHTFVKQLLFLESKKEIIILGLQLIDIMNINNIDFIFSEISYDNDNSLNENDILELTMKQLTTKILLEFQKKNTNNEYINSFYTIIYNCVYITEYYNKNQANSNCLQTIIQNKESKIILIDLNMLIRFQTSFENIVKSNNDVLIMYLMNFFDTTLFSSNNIDILFNLFKEIQKQYPQIEEFYIDILLNEYEKNINNVEISSKILNFVLSNNCLLLKSLELLIAYFKKDSLTPEDNYKPNSFLSVFNSQKKYLEILNKAINPFLDELLLYLFEIYILKYFSNKDTLQEKLINSTSRQYFNDCINLLYKKSKKLYNNLAELYAISYIKIYLMYMSKHYQEDVDGIMNIIDNDGSINLKKIIRFYYLKCLLANMRGFDEFIQIKLQRYQIKWLDNYWKKDDDYYFNYLLFDLNKIAEYKAYNELFEKNIKSNNCFLGDYSKENIGLFIDCSVRYFYSSILFSQNNNVDNLKNIINAFTKTLSNDPDEKLIKALLNVFIEDSDFSKIKELIEYTSQTSQIEMLLHLYKLLMIMIIFRQKISISEILSKVINKHKDIINIINQPFESYDCTIEGYDPISFRVLMMGLLLIQYYFIVINILLSAKLKDIFNLLEINWKILSSLFKKKRIDIHIFFNMFSNSQEAQDVTIFFQTDKKTVLISLIKNIISLYPEYQNKYKTENYLILNRTKEELRTILYELEPPSNYSQEHYPLLHRFMRPKYPNEQDIGVLMKIKQNQTKYPVIFSYFNYFDDIKIIENLSIINKVINELMQEYSYKKSRSQITAIQYPQDFINAINILLFEIGEDPIMINQKNSIFLLPDKYASEENKAIIKIYQYLIQKQNTILLPILETKHTKYKHIVDQCYHAINIQDALNNEWLSLKLDKDQTISSFEDIINISSARDCFEENQINYFNYQEITYNLDKIEDIMTIKLLKGKRLFNQELIYVVFSDEDFLNLETNVLYQFNCQFPQIEIENTTRQKIKGQMQKIIKPSEWAIDKFKDFLRFVLSKNYNEDTLLNKQLFNGNSTKDLFDKYFCKCHLSLKHLISFYNILEETFLQIKLLRNSQIKQKISDSSKKKILKYIEDKGIKHELKTILTRYMNRLYYNPSSHLNHQNSLFSLLLTRIDFWKIDFLKLRMEIVFTELKQLEDIKIGNSIDLYTYLH